MREKWWIREAPRAVSAHGLFAAAAPPVPVPGLALRSAQNVPNMSAVWME